MSAVGLTDAAKVIVLRAEISALVAENVALRTERDELREEVAQLKAMLRAALENAGREVDAVVRELIDAEARVIKGNRP